MTESAVTYCANHPDRETRLRCNRCGKYICAKCAIRTPTGYRCEECVRGQQKKFETAQVQDYILGFVVAAFLSGIGGFIASAIGFFGLLLAPVAGSLIAEAVRKLTGKRRAPRLFQVVAAGVVLGGAPFVLLPLLILLGGGGLGAIINLLWPLVYIFIAAPTAFYRLSGIQMNR